MPCCCWLHSQAMTHVFVLRCPCGGCGCPLLVACASPRHALANAQHGCAHICRMLHGKAICLVARPGTHWYALRHCCMHASRATARGVHAVTGGAAFLYPSQHARTRSIAAESVLAGQWHIAAGRCTDIVSVRRRLCEHTVHMREAKFCAIACTSTLAVCLWRQHVIPTMLAHDLRLWSVRHNTAAAHQVRVPPHVRAQPVLLPALTMGTRRSKTSLLPSDI